MPDLIGPAPPVHNQVVLSSSLKMFNLTRAQAFGVTLGSALVLITAGFLTCGDKVNAGSCYTYCTGAGAYQTCNTTCN